MSNKICNKPVAADQSFIRIVFSENRVWNTGCINSAFYFFPSGKNLCAGNMCTTQFCRAVNNRRSFFTSVFWIYIFTVNSRFYNYFVTSNGNISGHLNCIKRFFFRTISTSFCCCINIIFHKNSCSR